MLTMMVRAAIIKKLQEEYSIRGIARRIGRDISRVSREVHWNRGRQVRQSVTADVELTAPRGATQLSLIDIDPDTTGPNVACPVLGRTHTRSRSVLALNPLVMLVVWREGRKTPGPLESCPTDPRSLPCRKPRSLQGLLGLLCDLSSVEACSAPPTQLAWTAKRSNRGDDKCRSPARLGRRATGPRILGKDLIIIRNGATAVTTLGRASRLPTILSLSYGEQAQGLCDALIKLVDTLLGLMRSSRTWGHGTEMTSHVEPLLATQIPMYFAHLPPYWNPTPKRTPTGA